MPTDEMGATGVVQVEEGVISPSTHTPASVGLPISQAAHAPTNSSPTTSETQQAYPIAESFKIVKELTFAVVIFTGVSFVVGFFLMALGYIQDKAMYNKYDDLYQNYSNQQIQLKDQLNSQEGEINNLQGEINLLKAKNSYLK
jgi:hypothetical protein